MEILRSEKGASAVELAIVLPLLMAILFGIVEFSLLLYNKQVITNASREGARAGIVSAPAALSDSFIRDNIIMPFVAGKLITFASPPADQYITIPTPFVRVDRDGDGNTNSFGDELTVTVQYNYQFLLLPDLLGLLNGSFGQNRTITATTVMKMEGSGAAAGP